MSFDANLATRGNKRLHPNDVLRAAQKIISGDSSKPVHIKAFLPGMYVTVVLNEGHRVVRGTVKKVEVDRIEIETDGLTEVFKKHEILSILGRSVKGGSRRSRASRRARQTRRHRRA